MSLRNSLEDNNEQSTSNNLNTGSISQEHRKCVGMQNILSRNAHS